MIHASPIGACVSSACIHDPEYWAEREFVIAEQGQGYALANLKNENSATAESLFMASCFMMIAGGLVVNLYFSAIGLVGAGISWIIQRILRWRALNVTKANYRKELDAIKARQLLDGRDPDREFIHFPRVQR